MTEEQRLRARVQVLEARVFELEEELGLRREAASLLSLRSAFGLTRGEAWLLRELWRSKDCVSVTWLANWMPGNEDRLPNSVAKRVSNLRRKIVPLRIVTHRYQYGYGLGEDARVWMDAHERNRLGREALPGGTVSLSDTSGSVAEGAGRA